MLTDELTFVEIPEVFRNGSSITWITGAGSEELIAVSSYTPPTAVYMKATEAAGTWMFTLMHLGIFLVMMNATVRSN
jgi:hypothetical protein